ncbi:MAG: hypothetical protein ACK41T_06790 [Pseudobdellovibrio sp.]
MQFVLSHYMYQFKIKSGMLLFSVLSLSLVSACNKTAFSPAANSNQVVGDLSLDQTPVREPANEPPYIPKECILGDGSVIPHLGTVALYRSAQSNNCDAIKQVRTCADGVLSGSNSYQYLKCDPTGCELNGKSIAHGESVTVYKTSNLPYGSRCESELRTCSYGVLSGSYTNASCTVSDRAPASVETQVNIKFACSNSDSSASKNLLSSVGPFKYGTGNCKEDSAVTIAQLKSKVLTFSKCETPTVSNPLKIYDSSNNIISSGISWIFDGTAVLFDICILAGTDYNSFINNATMRTYIQQNYTNSDGTLDLNRSVSA